MPRYSWIVHSLVIFSFGLAWSRPVSAQTCNCSCDASIPPTLDVLKVFRNEGPGGPNAYVTAGRGSNPCHNTEISHANEIDFGGGAVITHFCINLKYPSGQPGDVAYAFIAAQDPNHQNLPGIVEHETPFVVNVNGGHQIVKLKMPAGVMGVKWAGVRYPTARCFTPHQGVGVRNPAALRAAVLIRGQTGTGAGWHDYDSTQSASYVGRAPLIRPLTLVPAGATGAGGGGGCGLTPCFGADLIVSYPTNASGMLETTELGGRGTVRVALAKAPTSTVWVLVNSTNPAEGSATTSLLTFSPANWNLPQQFDVYGIDDFLADGPINYRVDFQLTSADPCYNNLPVDSLNCVNLDDETSTALLGGRWTQPNISGSAPNFADPVSVYDSHRNVTVLFGGYPGSFAPGETWEWDGSNWHQVSISGPSCRSGTAMAFDAYRNVTVLMGGRDAGGNALSDTWEWDGATWSLRSLGAPNTPGPRIDHAMAFDLARGVTVLYGGDQPSVSGATWEWDGCTWTARNTLNYPSPRSLHSMAFDTRTQKVILFGGQVPPMPASDSDVWEYNGANWAIAATAGSKPSARSKAALAHDPVSGVSILYGGETGVTLGDTWEWDGLAKLWSRTTTAPSPGGRTRSAMAFDIPRGVATLFGGSGGPGSWIADTWTYRPIGPSGSLTTRYFQISGCGTGTAFAWGATSPSMYFQTVFTSLPPGICAPGIAGILTVWLGSSSGGQLTVGQLAVAPMVMSVATISSNPYSLTFGPAGSSPTCSPYPGLFCSFNPTITELLLDGVDCNGNGIDDVLDIANDPSLDANSDGMIDSCASGLTGDLNCDNVVNLLDVPDFVTALLDANGYALSHPNCQIIRADFNGDGMVDGADIQGFVTTVVQQPG